MMDGVLDDWIQEKQLGDKNMFARLVMATLVSLFVALPVQSADRYPGREWGKLDSPKQAGWSVTKLQEARKFSQTLDTAALMIVHQGL
ncbi:MAG: hypothetical protein VB912_09045, partial [Pirellulaceae bacterium]